MTDWLSLFTLCSFYNVHLRSFCSHCQVYQSMGKESRDRRSPPSFQKAICKSRFPTLACEGWTVLEPCSIRRSLDFEVRPGFEYWCPLRAVWPWAKLYNLTEPESLDFWYCLLNSPLEDGQEPVGEKSSFFFKPFIGNWVHSTWKQMASLVNS